MSRKILSSLSAGSGMVLLTIAICALLALPGLSESGQAGSKEQESLSGVRPSAVEAEENIERIQSRVLELQQEIARMRDQAMDDNPELDVMLRELVLTRNEIMSENLARENVQLERLEEINEQLENPAISLDKKKDLKEEKKKLFMGYKMAENRTAQSEKLQNLRERFYTELIETAKKENPAAEELIDELNMLQHQLQFARPDALPGGQ